MKDRKLWEQEQIEEAAMLLEAEMFCDKDPTYGTGGQYTWGGKDTFVQERKKES